MNLDVTQNNLYLFLPSKVSWMAEMLSEDKNVSIVDACSICNCQALSKSERSSCYYSDSSFE